MLISSALFVEYSSVGDTSQIIHLNHLHRIALRVIKEVLSFSPSVLSSDIPLGSTLLKKLYMTIDDSTQQLQTLLMEIILSIFRLEGGMKSLSSPSLGTSQRISRQRSITGKKAHLKENLEEALGPTSLLLHMFLDAFSSPGARPIISTWSDFFMECLPYFSSSIFPILIPTVDCIVREIGKALLGLQAIFQYGEGEGDNLLEQCLTLLNLLEGVVIRAHEVLRIEESKFNGKGAYDGAGFLNNVMSGMWGGDGANVRSGVANVLPLIDRANNRIGSLFYFACMILLDYAIMFGHGTNAWGIPKSRMLGSNLVSIRQSSLRILLGGSCRRSTPLNNWNVSRS